MLIFMLSVMLISVQIGELMTYVHFWKYMLKYSFDTI